MIFVHLIPTGAQSIITGFLTVIAFCWEYSPISCTADFVRAFHSQLGRLEANRNIPSWMNHPSVWKTRYYAYKGHKTYKGASEFRVLLLGRPGVGKRNLLQVYASSSLSPINLLEYGSPWDKRWLQTTRFKEGKWRICKSKCADFWSNCQYEDFCGKQ